MVARTVFFRVGRRGVVGKGVGGDFEHWKLLEDPDEVFPRVDLPATAGFDEGEPDGVALSRVLAAHEEPVIRLAGRHRSRSAARHHT